MSEVKSGMSSTSVSGATKPPEAVSSHETAPATAGVGRGRGGRRVPDGTKITFYIKDDETMKKLKAKAVAEHRDNDNMASFIIHKYLHTPDESKAS